MLPLYFATGAGKLGCYSGATAIVSGMQFFRGAEPLLFLYSRALRDPQDPPGSLPAKKKNRAPGRAFGRVVEDLSVREGAQRLAREFGEPT